MEIKREHIYVLIILLVMLISTFLILKNLNKNFENPQTKEIVLDTNSGVPFEWNCKIEDDSIAKIVKNYKENVSKSNVTGGAVKLHYVIGGLKEGNTKITCKYTNFVYNDIGAQKEYNIYVDKKLNVEIK